MLGGLLKQLHTAIQNNMRIWYTVYDTMFESLHFLVNGNPPLQSTKARAPSTQHDMPAMMVIANAPDKLSGPDFAPNMMVPMMIHPHAVNESAEPISFNNFILVFINMTQMTRPSDAATSNRPIISNACVAFIQSGILLPNRTHPRICRHTSHKPMWSTKTDGSCQNGMATPSIWTTTVTDRRISLILRIKDASWNPIDDQVRNRIVQLLCFLHTAAIYPCLQLQRKAVSIQKSTFRKV